MAVADAVFPRMLYYQEVAVPSVTHYLPIRVDPKVDPHTAVFFPQNWKQTSQLDVVLYLHGLNDAETIDVYLNKPERPYPLRELFNKYPSDNLIFVAPSLGLGSNCRYLKRKQPAPARPGPPPPGWSADDAGYTDEKMYQESLRRVPVAASLDEYLDLVLAGLAEFAPDQVGSSPDIANLYFAAHSRGGVHQIQLLRPVSREFPGKYGSRLRECWGFDQLYTGDGLTNPNAEWLTFCQANPQVAVYMYCNCSWFTWGKSLDAATTDPLPKSFGLNGLDVARFPKALQLTDRVTPEGRKGLLVEDAPKRDNDARYITNLWVQRVDVEHHYIPERFMPYCLARVAGGGSF